MNIKTNQITQGAIFCALYGILLFLNQQFGLVVETSLPCLFSLPILVYAAKNEKYASFLVMFSMGVMTLLFGSFTTWFYSWSSLLIGYVYGLGVKQKFSMMKNFLICLILSIFFTFFTVFVWAKLFGMELDEEFLMIQPYLQNMSIYTFMASFVLVLGLLESLCTHFMGILLLRRLRIELVPMKSVFEIKSSISIAIGAISMWVLYYLGTNVVECSREVLGILQVGMLVYALILDFYGTLVMLSLCLYYQKRKLAFLATLGAMLPGIQFLWMIAGMMDCFLHIREKMINKRILL